MRTNFDVRMLFGRCNYIGCFGLLTCECNVRLRLNIDWMYRCVMNMNLSGIRNMDLANKFCVLVYESFAGEFSSFSKLLCLRFLQ